MDNYFHYQGEFASSKKFDMTKFLLEMENKIGFNRAIVEKIANKQFGIKIENEFNKLEDYFEFIKKNLNVSHLTLEFKSNGKILTFER